jgi:hypothetical protein
MRISLELFISLNDINTFGKTCAYNTKYTIKRKLVYGEWHLHAVLVEESEEVLVVDYAEPYLNAEVEKGAPTLFEGGIVGRYMARSRY